MSEESRLGHGGLPRLEIADDIGDGDFVGVPPSGNIVRPAMAESSYTQSAPLPEGGGRASYRNLGVVDVSDVIAPNRSRRVYQSVRIRNNEWYHGSTFVVFQTSVVAIISEELETRSPTSASPTVMPSRTVATRTTPNSNITGQRGAGRGAVPHIGREAVPSTTMPTNSILGDRLDDWNTAAGTVGNAIDIDAIAMNFEVRIPTLRLTTWPKLCDPHLGHGTLCYRSASNTR